MNKWVNALPYFRREELQDHQTTELALDLRFASALPHLRQSWGRSLRLNSCCRSAITNAEVGGHPRSLHLITNPVHPTTGCMAADIGWDEWPQGDQYLFYELAWAQGWACGLHPEFIHVDRRVSIGLAQRTYHYDEWDARFADIPS